MKDLKCGLRACVHNRAYCCAAKKIAVDESADCTTYEPDETKRRSLFEAGEDFVPRDYSVDTFVKCDAKCVFNKDRLCYANGITVMNDKQGDAMCLTYIRD